ncbi:hypothetical protein L21SP5_02615 [Salinivirga cyanobacteriivorans]|uniref:DUF985 domain-containing protein n=1 Tax=Salinivirga cyanobacteriivorans TaxID=1307839 RepID=A0A0S2I1T3_9BACT|nr:cupin domain-containing protein [Salinivirga cyanobacteriivorans]ALO16238.1 hypothetical protein L21SP5_02615 [Salinivirga cyanobacteriivorans]
MKTEEQQIIENLNLKPHPEGGFFRETYRTPIFVAGKNLPESFGGRRNLSTSILFFLPAGNFSAFHRLRQDEVWYFHHGKGPVLHCIYPDNTYKKITLGPGIEHNQYPQFEIPANTLFAAQTIQNYALVGCLATPGFDFADLDMPPAAQLIKEFPDHQQIIKTLTRT